MLVTGVQSCSPQLSVSLSITVWANGPDSEWVIDFSHKPAWLKGLWSHVAFEEVPSPQVIGLLVTPGDLCRSLQRNVFTHSVLLRTVDHVCNGISANSDTWVEDCQLCPHLSPYFHCSKHYDNLLSISIHEEEIVLGQDMKITSFHGELLF